MALPTFQAAGTEASGTTSCTPAWPTHQADDIGLLFVETSGTAAPAAPSGWTQVTDSPQYADGGAGATRTRLSVFWRRAAGSSESTPTVTTDVNHVIAQILTFRGCITSGDPWDVTAGDNTGATTSTSVSIPGDTTTVADCLIVAACCSVFDTATDQFSSWANGDLANVTEQADAFTATGNGGGFGVATGEKASAGAYGATTATLANAANQGRISIALKPPAGGGTVTLDAAITVAAAVAAALAAERPLEASITQAATVTAGLAATRPLEATINGAATMEAEFSKVRLLEATLNGTSTMAADLAAQRDLACVIVCTSTVAAELIREVTLAAALALAATVTADLEVSGEVTLDAALTGQATIAAALAETRALEALLTGAALIEAELLVTNPGGGAPDPNDPTPTILLATR